MPSIDLTEWAGVPAAFYQYDKETDQYTLFDYTKLEFDHEPRNNFEEWVLRSIKQIPIDPEDVPF